MDRFTKSNITRLKHLLRDYRDHVITNRFTRFGDPIERRIAETDRSIEILLNGL